MTLDYNNSRIKTKTRVWDIAEIYSYNNIVNYVNYYVNNIDKDCNNNGKNNKSKSYNNDNNRELENDNNYVSNTSENVVFCEIMSSIEYDDLTNN